MDVLLCGLGFPAAEVKALLDVLPWTMAKWASVFGTLPMETAAALARSHVPGASDELWDAYVCELTGGGPISVSPRSEGLVTGPDSDLGAPTADPPPLKRARMS